MTKIVKNFTGFSKVYESEVNSDETAKIIDKAKEEMPLEVVADDAAQLVDPNKSDISDKMIQAQAQAQAQAQVEPELPSELKESVYTGKDLINPTALDSIMRSTIKRLPVLTSGCKIKFMGSLVDVPAGAEYVANNFKPTSNYYTVFYNDKTGRYKEAYINYQPSAEEIAHIKQIFDDLAKKSKWLNFLDKTANIAGPTLAIVGFGLFIFGMLKWNAQSPNKWLSTGGAGEGTSKGFSWDVVAPRGGYEAAVGGSLFGAGIIGLATSTLSDSKSKSFEESIGRLASVLKAYLEPLNMTILDLKNASDVHAVLNSNINNDDVAVEVPVFRGDSNIKENKNYKRK